MAGRAIGIDLGTSNSVASVVVDGEAIVIPDADGVMLQPSVVSFLPDGRTVVGRKAKSLMVIDPGHTVYSIKRLVGRPFYAPEISLALRKYAYAITRGEDDNPRVAVRNQLYTADEVQAIILRHLKKIAEDYLGEPVTSAVITVPANFNEAQRRATRNAGELAGLNVLRILNEPTAAALAYGHEQRRRERIAVYDFGGGTFDVTVLELRDNVFEVLSTAGDTFLGGDDFDLRIAGILADAFRNTYNVDLSHDRAAQQRMKSIAERMKIELTDADVATGHLKQPIPGQDGPVDFEFSLTREQFNQSCLQIVQKTFLVCDEALKLANLTSAEVDRLVLVGGSTRVPIVRDMVREYFFKEPMIDINPDEVVAVGAAIYAYGLEEQNAPAQPPPPPPRRAVPPPTPGAARTAAMGAVPPPPPGTRPSGAVPPPPGTALGRLKLVPPPTPMMGRPAPPATMAMGAIGAPPGLDEDADFVMEVDDSNASLDLGDSHLPVSIDEDAQPFEAPADDYAAPQPVRVAPHAMPLLIDVTSQSLGIETLGGHMDIIVRRNTTIPTRASRAFATSRDNQDTVIIQIFEGDSARVDQNRKLGELTLLDLPQAPRGDVRIDVAFEINADGMLHVIARDRSTGRIQQTRLNVAGG